MLETLEQLSGTLVGMIWGVPLVVLLFGAGFIFTVFFGFPQFRLFRHAIDITLGKYDKEGDEGQLSHFQALCTALSATIGLGNIAGVAIAISAGGPGAIFWMWIAGLLGMATKFTSISLALMFRQVDSDGTVHGGPMYTLKHGLGNKFMPLAIFYSICIVLASFGAGNMFQSNQMASILSQELGIPGYISGAVFCVLAALVLIGGIRRIGEVAGKLVPTMVALYFIGVVGILVANFQLIPSLLMQIVTDAFTGTAAVGGFAGVAFREVVIQGARRAVFSSEAGLGSAAIAHSAAKSNPMQEGIVGLLEPFIDTIVVCTLTALALLATGVWTQVDGMGGSELTATAFASLYGGWGSGFVTMTVVLFAFSTIISWSYYGEQGIVFMFGNKGIMPYRVVFVAAIMAGAIWKLSLVLNIADAVTGLLVIPNLIANFMLSGRLKKELKEYERSLKPPPKDGQQTQAA